MKLSTIALILLFSSVSIVAFAVEQPPKPPKEALAACVNHKNGDKCSFKGFRGETISGICRQTQTEMSCMPDKMPPRKDGDRDGDRPKPE